MRAEVQRPLIDLVSNDIRTAITDQNIGVQASSELDAKSTAQEIFVTFFTEDMDWHDLCRNLSIFWEQLQIMRETSNFKPNSKGK